jgi:hypothetical protein
MADDGTLTIHMTADQAPYFDVYTTPAHTTTQNMTGYALKFVIRRTVNGRPDQTATGLVFSATTASGISIGDGAGTGSRATVTITDADITSWTPGRNYRGALWRTDDGSDTPIWDGPVVLLEAAAQ